MLLRIARIGLLPSPKTVDEAYTTVNPSERVCGPKNSDGSTHHYSGTKLVEASRDSDEGGHQLRGGVQVGQTRDF